MHLTKSTEQAICIMVMLYFQDRRIYLNSKEISDRLDISPTYLKKIMRKLVVNNLVKASTGVGGGYRYRENKKVSLYDIYEAINGPIDLFVLKTDYIARIFKGAKEISRRYEEYLSTISEFNKILKQSLLSVTIEDIARNILQENSTIRLDWNNWQEEFERIYSKLEKK
ncbi:Rrf2 family transcriptional regulator [Gemella sp. GH3]|uniref:RrF2 family transcriptional regulator n=1 Tax=unclassified Gemella TaxID=2624949 RepID=UPI0015D0C37B|nr:MULTISPECIES: Rrf2 family transcriptional regulator [unclassified Gemella]MBF0713503.1 Rrf2 family transcriptional regulator [Gemella sp. GH3.1]NYS50455.1 Rrf2 family transcriptional regulator [Gemella sp. GH3]